MGLSSYMQRLRAAVGSQLLVLPAVTGIIFDENGRVLLIRQRDLDLWSTPGGMVEPNETPADAVVREVWEETGLHVDPTAIIGVFGGPQCEVTYPNGDRVAYVTTVFRCRVRAGEVEGVSAEGVEAEFVDPFNLSGRATTGWARFLLPKLLGSEAAPVFDPPQWRPANRYTAG